MKKDINLILTKFLCISSYKLYRKSHKRWLRLPDHLRIKIIKRKIIKLFGLNVKKSDEEIKQLQEEFLNYEYRGE